MADLFSALRTGFELGMAFNPLVTLVGSIIAAGLLATGRGWRRAAAATSVLFVAWLIGDGWMILDACREISDGTLLVQSAQAWPSWLALGVWAVVGLGVGYAAPTLAGAFAGRRVTWGTGWLTAGSLAAAVSAALSQIAKSIG